MPLADSGGVIAAALQHRRRGQPFLFDHCILRAEIMRYPILLLAAALALNHAVCCHVRMMSPLLTSLNPAAVTEIEYVPRGRSANEYSPLALAIVSRWTPVLVSVR